MNEIVNEILIVKVNFLMMKKKFIFCLFFLMKFFRIFYIGILMIE